MGNRSLLAPGNYQTVLTLRFPENTVSCAYRAFADLYGDNTTALKTTGMVTFAVVKPEFSQFIGYLTRVDPAFPSWECANVTVTAPDFEPVEVVRPCFRARIERLHKFWLRYQAESH